MNKRSGSTVGWALSWTAGTLLLLSFAPRLEAQVLYGQLVGTVQDPSGSYIANAKVSILNKGTGLSREGQSDDQGRYTFTTVQTGIYDVTVAAPGFKGVTQTGIDITVNSVRTLDFRMEVGAVTESIQV
ncbi:MAG: carboxypeptidase regulatory-like domain-containing protein [Bryobacterales bacterium]|nr:carboxypeptidase regulatory-like domain-containing protein [Bryobacterales bacterium]